MDLSERWVILELYQTAAANWFHIFSFHDVTMTFWNGHCLLEIKGCVATFGTEISRQFLSKAPSWTSVQHILTVHQPKIETSILISLISHLVITFQISKLFFLHCKVEQAILTSGILPIIISHEFAEFIIYQHKTLLKRKHPFQA